AAQAKVLRAWAPATHWIGAKFDGTTAFVRGVVDASAADLKRWIRARTIRTVSIFGRPTLAQVAGETHVTSFQLLSIDWTPLGRAGIRTSIVALGEMDSIELTKTGIRQHSGPPGLRPRVVAPEQSGSPPGLRPRLVSI
ncbi:MAG TPA: hypothetical protein VGW38_04100, partial [Chloroflexota bacterium]|nr:hypothetical protein [Chloroflexota bacterium]